MPGRQDWQGPPLQSGQANVLNALSQSIGNGSNHAYTIPVNRPGYVVKFHFRNTTDTITQLPVGVELEWKDTTINTVLDRQLWFLFAGTNASAHFVIGTGPTAGDQLLLTIFNNATTATNLSVDSIMDVTTQQPYRHDWWTDQQQGFVIPGWTAATGELNSELLAYQLPQSLAAAGSLAVLLPLYSRRVRLHAETASGLADLTSQIQIPPPRPAASAVPLLTARTDATGNLNLDTYLPRYQCTWTLTNNNAGAQTVAGSVVAGQG